MRLAPISAAAFSALGLFAALPAAAMLAPQAAPTFEVFAKEDSTAFQSLDQAPLSTGITLAAGQAFSITATGLWSGGGCPPVDANGAACFGTAPITGINYFSLVGKIGADSSYDASWFKVGTSYSGVAANSGTLFLAFLDSDSFNNSGSVMATVSVVPEPGTWALLGAGLVAVAAVAKRRRG
jgi:hypothetical protein